MGPAPAIWACLLGAVTAAPVPASATVPVTLADCDALVEEDPGDLASYRCYWFVGRNHAQLSEAANRLESLLADDPANPRIQLFLGIVGADLGDARAERLYRESMSGFASERDARGEVYARVSLAMFLRQRARNHEASPVLEEGLERAVASRDPELENQVRIQLGWQRYYERDYGAARELLSQAERTVFPDGSIHLRLDVLDGLGAVAWALGRFDDALAQYRRMVELLRGTDPYRESAIRRNMALVAESLVLEGRISLDEMTRLCRDALEATMRAGNRLAESGARLMLAKSLRGPEGLEQARAALRLARETNHLGDTCWALWLVGEKTVALHSDRSAEGFAAVEEAIGLARERGDPERLAQGLVVRAAMRWTTGPRDLATAESLVALDAVESIRDLQPDREVRARVFGRFAHDYRWLAGKFLDSAGMEPSRSDVEQAFHVMERGRARTLLDIFDAAGATESLAPSGPLATERSRTLDEIVARRSELSRPGTSRPERERVLAELAELQEKEAAARAAISRADPDFAAFRGFAFPTLRAVQAALRPDQALLSFLVEESAQGPGTIVPSGSWVVVVTSSEARAIPLPDCEGLRSRVRLFLALIERRDGSERTGAERLHQDLLADAVKAIPRDVTTLVVVPDGSLHRLPFGALVDTADARSVAQRFEVFAVPSAATWLRWAESETPSGPAALLALADPALPAGGAAGDLRSSGLLELRQGLGALPHARREVEAMRRHLGSDGLVFTGEQASERALKGADLSRYRVIHLAAHAVANDERPERSAVVLAGGASGGADDGLLRFREIVDLDLDGQLVLLSACRGASGPLIGGEGVMGLANAFFQAGARTVVAGLWPVRDREAAALVDRLGTHLAEGHGVARSLTLAQRDLIRGGAPPAAWAGMVVLGDGDLAPFPDRRPETMRPPWVAVLALASVLAAFLVLLLTRAERNPGPRAT